MTTARIPDFSNLLKRSPGLKEIEAILDIYPDALLLIDVDFSRVYKANANATQLSAYTRQELTTTPLKKILPSLIEIINPAATLTTQEGWETVLFQRGGGAVVVQIKAHLLGQSSQWALLSIKKNTEIQQKEVEQKLLNQRWEALNSLVSAAQHPTLKKTIKQVLQAGQLLTGASLLALYTKTDSQLFTKSHAWGNAEFLPTELPISELNHLRVPYIWVPGKRTISELHRLAMANKTTYLASIPIPRTDESSESILVLGDQIATPPLDLNTYLKILASTIATSHHHHRITQQLQMSDKAQTRLRNISHAVKDAVNDGIILVTKDFKIINLNNTAEVTLGYNSTEVSGQPLENIFIGPKSLIPVLKANTQAAGQDLRDLGDIKLHRRDGQTILCHIRTLPLDAISETGTIAILISDLSQHEEFRIRTNQLEQQALLGEVTAIFAHEVRNPINNISTGLQLMAYKLPPDAPMQEQVKRLKQDCDRLDELMKSVLSFSSAREYKMAAVDIEVLINSLLTRWRPRLERANIQTQIQISTETPAILGDRQALEQVFTNLISNAIQAMKKNGGGILGVKSEPSKVTGQQNIVQIDISDNGPGIPPEIKERIFAPFFTTNQHGTGLGLSITRRIVAAHNGQINLDSFPGGTVFQLKLPRA